MTTLREAAQQALEALLDDPNKLVQISENHWESKRDLTVIALRVALIEPDETEALRRENERLRKVLNKLEYSSDGTIKRHPTESEVEAALQEQHNCTLDSLSDVYGIAMDICYEKDDGTFWVSNGEYASQVNYCPVCGAKAPKQVEQPK